MKKILLLIVSVFMTGSLVYGQTGKVIHINQSEFIEKVYDYKKNPDKWVYEGSKPAIVDFYADWCGPCRRLSPVLEKLAEKYKDKIVIYKVNTDKERELAAAFGITSLPTLVFIPLRDTPQVSQGALPQEVLEKGIEEVLLK
ncbi:thioredoxin [Phocaeicola coprocola]|jgi:thioredoxin 1|uniref:Thioredoxin n=1 Tax=Phocaeicola coprocola DSM 17136 TaxID=470145 RepID=B3JHT7_9BACT|nr:thioredoxin [Phocaeicola coprocola]EDV01506.1 thioredoxin [Phocaeicola coprocola DSM 17136]